MKSFKPILALLLFVLFSQSAAAAAQEKVTIAQWGQAKILLYMPLYIAMEDGLFAKRGLDVDLRFGGNEDQVLAAVISGSADFGLADPAAAAISKEKGGPGKVVALIVTKLGLSGFTNKVEVPTITDLKQLEGLRVGSFPEPSTTYTLLSQMKKESAPGMQIVQMAFGAQVASLEAGKTDMALDFEPTVSIAENKGYRVIFDFEKYSQPQAITGLTTTEDVIKQKPEIVQKVVDALQEAMTLLHKDPEVSIRTMKKAFPDLNDSIVKASVKRMLEKGVYPDSVVMSDEYWQRTLETRIASGDLKKPQATDVAVDNSFALKAQGKK